MNVNNVSLEGTVVRKDQYPDIGLPEVAFVGKSNVGKSSLINVMVNRKALARTSSSPGKTRTINFFNVENKLLFVDLPGYGYAKVSKSESEKWGSMIETYLLKREELHLIVMLVDIRHEPSENDKLMINWLRHYQANIVVVATKSDKLSKQQVIKSTGIIKNALELNSDEMIVPFSKDTRAGKDELWDIIERSCDIK